MSLTDIFKDAFKYPLSDWKKLLILGVLFVLASLATIFKQQTSAIVAICSIISLVVAIFLQGYDLSVVRASIAKSDSLPDFAIEENFVDGLKLLVVNIVYAIIIFIISFVLILIVGGGAAAAGAFSNIAANTNNVTALMSNPSILATSIVIVLVVFIVVVVVGILATMATCRLAKSGSIGNALKIGEAFGDLKTIGIGRFIGWYILLIICLVVVGIILTLIGIIPIIGGIIVALIGVPYMSLFGSRALGLLYSEV